MRIYRMMFVSGLLVAAVLAQDAVTFSKGVKRWSIKTSLMPGTISKPPVAVTFSKLRGLDPPAADLLQHPENRMRKAGESGLQEGDVVQTEGYIQLVALEASKKSDGTRTDGDYHIQVSDSRTDRDNVVIAEVPYSDFVSNAQLKTKVDALRAKLRSKLHKGQSFP